MSLVFILLLLLGNTLIGLGVFLRNPRLPLNQCYVAFVFALNTWIFANYFENEPTFVGVESIGSFLRLDFAFAPILFYFLFRFAVILTKYKSRFFQNPLMNAVFIALLAPAVILPFHNDLLIRNIYFSSNVIHFESGPMLIVYITILCTYVFLGLATLFLGRRIALREGDAIKKKQIDLIFTGAALSLGTAVIVNLTQTVTPIGLEVSRIGLYGMFFLVAFSAYAVVRARFFEIKFALGRAIGFLVLAVLLAGSIVATLFLLAAAAFHVTIDVRVLISAVVITVVVAAAFEHVRRATERFTDQLFFKGRYNPDLVLKRIGKILIEAQELEDMGNQIVAAIAQEFRLEKTAIILESNHGMIWHARGFPETFPNELQSVLFGGGAPTPISFDELPEGPNKDLLRKFDIALSLPLRVKNKDIAILLLGNKLSGEPFREEDISLLETISSEVAIGIQNAKSFDDLKRLSQELEQRVAERTRELEASQKQEVAKALEVSRLKDEFVFLAVHELRTPIAAIQGFLELTEGAQKNFPLDIRRNLTAISDASAHMNHVINDLLEIARSDSGLMKMEVSSHEFKPILDKVMKGVASLIKQRKLRIETNIQELPNVLCDTQKLKEVLENLVGNAIKYNREGGEVFINVFRPAGEQHMIFEIRDTGYGIPRELQTKIFEKFFRAVTRETQEVVGSGLGLFITRMLVERMGGTLMFSSLEHEGSTFAFTLPLANEN